MAKIQHELTLRDDATRIYTQFVGNVNRQAATLDNTMKGIGTTIGAAFTVGAVVNFMKAGADAEAQTLKLEQALAAQGLASEENKKALLDNSQILKNKLAIDDDEINRLQAMIVGMTGNVQATRQLTPLIFDMSHALGVGADQVARMLARTNEGEETLKRYGITIGKTSSEQERLGKIIEEVTKKYGGQRAAFAQSDAGKIELATVQMEDFGEEIGKVLNDALIPFIPTFKALEPAAKLIGGALYMVYGILTQFSAGLVGSIAIIERLNNVLGITSSTFFTELAGQLERNSQQWAAMAFDIDTAGKAAATTGEKVSKAGTDGAAGTVLLSEQIKTLKKEISELNINSDARIQKLVALNALEQQQKEILAQEALKVMELTGQWNKFNQTMTVAGLQQSKMGKEYKNMKVEAQGLSERTQEAVDNAGEFVKQWSTGVSELSTMTTAFLSGFNSGINSVATNAGNWMYDAFDRSFKGANSMLEQFTANVLASIAQIAAQQLAAGAVAGLLSLIPGVGSFGTIFTLLGGIFHEGGTVPKAHDGMYINAPPSQEFPIIVRGGETIRTEAQESALQRSSGGTTFIFNNYANITNEQAAMELLGKIGRMLGVSTVGDIKVNQRSNLAIA